MPINSVYATSFETEDVPAGVSVNKIKVVGEQEDHIADASVAHALNATFSDTEVETALDALGTKVNAILTVLENHGLVASS